MRVYSKTNKEGVYKTIKVTTDYANIFIEKKNGKKRMVQDYQYLNEWTVNNNYPLPFISDMIKNIRTKKIFTKTDLR